MIAGAIDIGTNTTLALLAEAESGRGLRVLKDSQTPNRLGEGLRSGSGLAPETIALNIDLLGEIVREFRMAGAQDFALCGTSALRMAKNREEFLRAVHEILHLKVDVLSGTAEASLTFAGATSDRELLPNEPVGVIDLGGGSTEVIQGRGSAPRQTCSLDMGAVYLTKQYFPENGIPSPEAAGRLRAETAERMRGILAAMKSGGIPWIFVGGTAVTLAMLKLELARYMPDRIAGTSLTLADLDNFVSAFAGKHPHELQMLPGMPLGRGKYIFAGTLLLREVMHVLEIQEGRVTERGLRHGLWLAKFRGKEQR
jgi:exopolyphosphatase/guanosine-5'-triphosphate,3'-diphosphate pyrophosphatase